MTVKNPLRELFKKMLNSPYEDPSRYIIVIVHRGEVDDRAEFKGSDITAARRDGFEVQWGDKTTYIPYHRVLYVKKDGEIIYAKRKLPSAFHGD